MATVVVDASVIVKWYFLERGSDLAIDLLQSKDVDPVVPDIAILEVSNALLRREREKIIDSTVSDAAFADLRRMFSAPYPSLPLMPRAVEIARILSHPLPDCVYLALAEHLGCRLVTADEAFIAHTARGGRNLGRRVEGLSEFKHDPS